LYANLGVAQVERLLERDETWRIRSLVDRLRADGLILHVNPLQEWLQPEGDRFAVPPLETITTLLARTDIPLIVKEVGQGMGIDSLKALFRLPLQAIDFAAAGGTNFAKLELLRSDPSRQAVYESLARVGHTAPDMVGLATAALQELGDEVRCHQVIISGGVRDFLDGYYLINKLPLACVYGQAAPFLQHARGTYQALHDHVAAQVSGLELATALLRVR
jgi:isopentenyl-diphosphate delta-isomerase